MQVEPRMGCAFWRDNQVRPDKLSLGQHQLKEVNTSRSEKMIEYLGLELQLGSYTFVAQFLVVS